MKRNPAKIAIATLVALVCISGTFLLASQPASANNRFVHHVRAQLAALAIAAGLADFELLNEPTIDALVPGATNLYPLNLRSGVSYGFVGVCDGDCSDLDLKLYNASGGIIAADTATDDTPTVGVSSRYSGTYYLEVNMANCRTNYCYYGFGIFGR
jgi:hypothetical protein